MNARTRVALGLMAGMGVAGSAALLMGQGSTYQPGKEPAREPARAEDGLRSDYFVTGDASRASLWMRDGTSLRWIASAEKMGRDTRSPHEPGDQTSPSPK